MESSSVKASASSESPEGSAAGAAAEMLTSPTTVEAAMNSNSNPMQAGNFPHTMMSKNLERAAIMTETATAAESAAPMQSCSPSRGTGTPKSEPASTEVFATDIDWTQWSSLPVTPLCGCAANAPSSLLPDAATASAPPITSPENPLAPSTTVPHALPMPALPFTTGIVTPAGGTSASTEMSTAPALETLGRVSVLSTDGTPAPSRSPPRCDPVASCHDFCRRPNSDLGVPSSSSVPLLQSTSAPLAISLGGNSSCRGDSATAATAVSLLSTPLSQHCSWPHPLPLLNRETPTCALSPREADTPLVPPSSPSDMPSPLPVSSPSPQESTPQKQMQQAQLPADVVAHLNPSLLLMAQSLCSCPSAEVMCPVLVVENSRTCIAAPATASQVQESSWTANQVESPPAYATAENIDSQTQKPAAPLSLGQPPYPESSSSSPCDLDTLQPRACETTVFKRKENETARGSCAASVKNWDTSDANAHVEGDSETASTPVSKMLESISETLMCRTSQLSHNAASNVTPDHREFLLEQSASDRRVTPLPCAWPVVYANDAAVSMLGCSNVDEVTAAAFDHLFCCFVLDPPPNTFAGSMRSNMPLTTGATETDGTRVPFTLASIRAMTSASSSQAACSGEKGMVRKDEPDHLRSQTHQQPSFNARAQAVWREMHNADELFAPPKYKYVILFCKRTAAYYAALAVSYHQPKMSQLSSADGGTTPWPLPATVESTISASINVSVSKSTPLTNSLSTTQSQSLCPTPQQVECYPPVPKKSTHPNADVSSSRLAGSVEATAMGQCKRRVSTTSEAMDNSPHESDLSGGVSAEAAMQQQRYSRYVEIYILQRLESGHRPAGVARISAARVEAAGSPSTLVTSGVSTVDARGPGTRTTAFSTDHRRTVIFASPLYRPPRSVLSTSVTAASVTATGSVDSLDVDAPHPQREQYVNFCQHTSQHRGVQNQRRLPSSNSERSSSWTASHRSERHGSLASGMQLTFGSPGNPSANSDAASAMQSTLQHTNESSLCDLPHSDLHVNLAQPTITSSDSLYGANEQVGAVLLATAVARGSRGLPLTSLHKSEEGPCHSHSSRPLSQKTPSNTCQPNPKEHHLLHRQHQDTPHADLGDEDEGHAVIGLKHRCMADSMPISPVLQPASETVSRQRSLSSAPLLAKGTSAPLPSGARPRKSFPLYQQLPPHRSGRVSSLGSTCLQLSTTSTAAPAPALALPVPWRATQELHSVENVIQTAHQLRAEQKPQGRCEAEQLAAFVSGSPPSFWSHRNSKQLSPLSLSLFQSHSSLMCRCSRHSGDHRSLMSGVDAAGLSEHSVPHQFLPNAKAGGLQQQPSGWVAPTETSAAQMLGNVAGMSWQRSTEVDSITPQKLADRVRSQRGVVAVLVSTRLPPTIIFNSVAFMMFVQHILRFQYSNGATQVACILNVCRKMHVVIEMIPVEALLSVTGRAKRSATRNRNPSTNSTSPANHRVGAMCKANNGNTESTDGSNSAGVDADVVLPKLIETYPNPRKAKPNGSHPPDTLPSSTCATSSQHQQRQRMILELLWARLEDLDVLYGYEESREAFSSTVSARDDSVSGFRRRHSSSDSGPFASSDSSCDLPTATTSSIGTGVVASSLPSPLGGNNEGRTVTPLPGVQSLLVTNAVPRQRYHNPLQHSKACSYSPHLQQHVDNRSSSASSPTTGAPIIEPASNVASSGDHQNRRRRTASGNLGTYSGTNSLSKRRGAMASNRGAVSTVTSSRRSSFMEATTGASAAAHFADGSWAGSVTLSHTSSSAATATSGTADTAREGGNSSILTNHSIASSHTFDPAFSEVQELVMQQQPSEDGLHALSKQCDRVEKGEGSNEVIEAAAEGSPRLLPSRRTGSGKQSPLCAYPGVESALQVTQHSHRRRSQRYVPSSYYLSQDMQESLAMCDASTRIRTGTYEARLLIPFTTPQRLKLLSHVGNVQLSKYRGLSVFGVRLVNLVTAEAAAEAAQPSPKIIPLRYDIAARTYFEGARGKSVIFSPLMSPTSADVPETEGVPPKEAESERANMAAANMSRALRLRPPPLQALSSAASTVATASVSATSSKDLSLAHTRARSIVNSSSPVGTLLSAISTEELPNVEGVDEALRRGSGATALGEATPTQRHTDPFKGPTTSTNEKVEGTVSASDALVAAVHAEAVKDVDEGRRRLSGNVGECARQLHHGEPLWAGASSSGFTVSTGSLRRKSAGLQIPEVLLDDTIAAAESKSWGTAVAKNTENENLTTHSRKTSRRASMEMPPQRRRGSKDTAQVGDIENLSNTTVNVSTTVACSPPQQRGPQGNFTSHSYQHVAEPSARSGTLQSPATSFPELKQTTPHARLPYAESGSAVPQSPPMGQGSNISNTSCEAEVSGASITSSGGAEKAIQRSCSDTPTTQSLPSVRHPSCLPDPIVSCTTHLAASSRNPIDLISTQCSKMQSLASVCTQKSGGAELLGYTLSSSAAAAFGDFSIALKKEGNEHAKGRTEDKEEAEKAAAKGAGWLGIPTIGTPDTERRTLQSEHSASLSGQAHESVIVAGVSTQAALPSTPFTTLAGTASAQSVSPHACADPHVSTTAEEGDVMTSAMEVMLAGVSTAKGGQKSSDNLGNLVTPAVVKSRAEAADDWHVPADCGNDNISDKADDSFADSFMDIFGLANRPQQLADLRRCVSMRTRSVCDHAFLSTGSSFTSCGVTAHAVATAAAVQWSTSCSSTVNRGWGVTWPIWSSTSPVSPHGQSRANEDVHRNEGSKLRHIAGLSGTATTAEKDVTPYTSATIRAVAEEEAEQTARNNLHVLAYTAHPYPEVEEVLGIYGHCTTFVTSATKMLSYARSGLQLFDVVIVEWVDALISGDMHDMLAKHAVVETVVAFFISTRPGVHTPTMNVENIMTDTTVVMYADNLLEGLLSRNVLEEVQQLIRRRRLLRSMVRAKKEQSYQIVSRIGSGAFGDVFEVMMYVSRGRLAMKRIFLKSMKLRQLEIINREVSIMRSLEHPNIVSFSHTRLEDNAYAIFMELCDGSLANYLLEPFAGIPGAAQRQQYRNSVGVSPMAKYRGNALRSGSVLNSSNSASGNGVDGKVDVAGMLRAAVRKGVRAKFLGSNGISVTAPELTRPRDAVMIVHDIASALIYLHRRGIIHRDIKPANVLFANGMAKLGDFGSAVKMMESRQLRNMKGTVSYMAPEMVLGEPYTESCDLWSFGCLIARIMGIHLGHLNGLHMPALNELYRAIPTTGSLPLTFTNHLSSRFGNHYTEETTNSALKALKRSIEMDMAERQLGTPPPSRSSVDTSSTVEGKRTQCNSPKAASMDDAAHFIDTASMTSAQESRNAPEQDGTGTSASESDTEDRRRRVLCITASNTVALNEFSVLLPASLVDLFNRLFHRDPTKRMTAAEVLDHQVSWDVEWMTRMMQEIYQVSLLIAQRSAGAQAAAGKESRCGVRGPANGRRPPYGDNAGTGAARPSITAGNFAYLPLQPDSSESAWMNGSDGVHIPAAENNYVLDLSLSGGGGGDGSSSS
ncbi:protein kinase, putative [Leishmania tarentolae]|uniref:Protein kinase, putative n=1 Tax=Leishmania tarentolae TaxID=5689 RepID=A0A640KGD3_LEITA|nr:protein kinase, putative [Leishmania tarentolae]